MHLEHALLGLGFLCDHIGVLLQLAWLGRFWGLWRFRSGLGGSLGGRGLGESAAGKEEGEEGKDASGEVHIRYRQIMPPAPWKERVAYLEQWNECRASASLGWKQSLAAWSATTPWAMQKAWSTPSRTTCSSI